jgi:hypothetical protein
MRIILIVKKRAIRSGCRVLDEIVDFLCVTREVVPIEAPRVRQTISLQYGCFHLRQNTEPNWPTISLRNWAWGRGFKSLLPPRVCTIHHSLEKVADPLVRQFMRQATSRCGIDLCERDLRSKRTTECARSVGSALASSTPARHGVR